MTGNTMWRTSSYSGGSGGDCVEVRDDTGRVLVRDTKDRTGPVLPFTPQAWQRFADRVKHLLASIPGAVIELSPPTAAGDADGRDMGRCLALPCRTTRGPQPGPVRKPSELCKDPQVTTVSLSQCPDSARAFRPR